jgi:hypothetical protein
MGFLDSIIQDNVSVSCQIQTVSRTLVNGVLGAEVWSNADLLTGLFWTDAVADAVVSEKYRTLIDGVFVCNFSSALSIPDTARCVIDSEYYSVIFADNIADQNRIFMIGLKKYAS